MATWPTTLPYAMRSGYELSPLDQTLRTDMESGPARVRRLTKARNDKITVTWMMTATQLAAFRIWFESDSDCAGGQAWFDMNVNTDGIVESKVCRFVGPWKASLIDSVSWSVAAQIEIR